MKYRIGKYFFIVTVLALMLSFSMTVAQAKGAVTTTRENLPVTAYGLVPCGSRHFDYVLYSGDLNIVSHVNEIKGVDLEFTPEGVLIQVEITQRCFMELKQQRRNMAGRTGCGLCGVAQLEEAVKPVIRVDSDARFNIDHLQLALEQIKENQPVHKDKSGVQMNYESV